MMSTFATKVVNLHKNVSSNNEKGLLWWFDTFKPTENLGALTTLLASVILLLIIYLRKFRNKGEENVQISNPSEGRLRSLKDIPLIKPLVLGFRLPVLLEGLINATKLRRDGVALIEELKLGGTICRVPVLIKDCINVAEPNLIQKILNSNDTKVLNKPQFFYHHVFTDWMRQGLLASDVKIWQPHRKILNRFLAYKTLPTYVKTMNKHSKNTVAEMLSIHRKVGHIPSESMHISLYFNTVKIISEMLMGEGTFTDSESETFHHHYQTWKELMVYRLMNPSNLFPPIWWLNPLKRKFDAAVKGFAEYMTIGVEKCKNQLKSDAEAHNINGISKSNDVINGKNEKKEFRSLVEEMLECNASENEIYSEIATMLSAGHETSMSALTFFLQHMADHPEIQATCRQEIDSVLGLKGDSEETDRDFTLDDLSELKYLERCILETHRRTSPVPLIFREFSESMIFDDIHFKKGQVIGISSWVMHMDEKYYPNPYVFDPDRFLPENIKSRHPGTYLPFSIGPRNCVGMKIAIIELKVILAWIIRNFYITSEDKLTDLKILFHVTLKSERDYKIILKKR